MVQQNRETSMKKVTMQTIADALNISRVSVWKVFNNQPGVSEQLRSKIMETANHLGYYHFDAKPAVNSMYEATPYIPTVSVVVSRPDSASFWMKIIHRIAEDFTSLGYNLLYTYLPADYTPGYTLPPNLTNGNVDGIIVLNVYNNDMLQLLNAVNIPIVFLDLPPSMELDHLHGDLFLLEGEHTIRQITESLLSNNCKRIGFIGDIHYSRTNAERYEGYQDALSARNMKPESNLCLIRSLGVTNYKNEVRDFLDSVIQMPDAFVCVNDHIAKVTYDYLTLHGYAVPDDVLLSGYDGVSEYFSDTSFLTTANVDTQQLGCRLVNQLVYRLQFPNAPYEITHVKPGIQYGASTISHKKKS